MYCNKCNAPLPDGSVFCSYCGSRLEQQGFVQDAVQMPPPKKNYAGAIVFSVLGALALTFLLLFAFNIIEIGERQSPKHTYAPAAAVEETEKPKTTEEKPEKTEEMPEGPDYYQLSDDELIDYFCKIALYTEYNDSSVVIKRWEKPIRVKVTGDYTSEDYETLKKHIDKLNGLGVLPGISIVSSNENFSVYFVTLDRMGDVLPGYVEGNWGYFTLNWDGDYKITKASMGIATDVTTQEARNHLILEEFTQALGLMNDSRRFEDSIYQADWTTTQQLADIDYMLVYMLYNDYIKTGMGEAEVRRILADKLWDIVPDDISDAA